MRLDSGDVLRLAQEASSIWSIYMRSAPLILLLAVGLLAVSMGLAHLLTARLVQPIEQMTSHLNNVSGVARYPELEPFMDMIEQQHEEILRSANMRVEFSPTVTGTCPPARRTVCAARAGSISAAATWSRPL